MFPLYSTSQPWFAPSGYSDSPATSSQPSSVDRSDPWSSSMTMKPSRTLKASRRNLIVGLDYNDTKKSPLTIDNDDHDIFRDIITNNPYDESRDTSSKRFSPLPPKLRTIRRQRRLSIGRPSSSPEATSLTPPRIRCGSNAATQFQMSLAETISESSRLGCCGNIPALQRV
jgi:hypothetical protein